MPIYRLVGREPFEYHDFDAGIHEVETRSFLKEFEAEQDELIDDAIKPLLTVQVFRKEMQRTPEEVVRVIKKW